MSEYDDLVVGTYASYYWDTEDPYVTWKDLKTKVFIKTPVWESNQTGVARRDTLLATRSYTLMQLTDKGCSHYTDLSRRFDYDPHTGVKIPWDELRAEAKAIEGG